MTSLRRRLHMAAASTGSTKNATMRVMLPPRGLAKTNNGTDTMAVSAAARRSTRADGRQHDDEANARRDDAGERGATEWEHPGIREQQRRDDHGGDREHAHRDRNDHRGLLPVAPTEPQVDHDSAESDPEEHAGDRAGQRGERGGDQPEGSPAAFVCEKGDETECETEPERKSTDGQIDRRPDGEPAGGERTDGPEVARQQRGERTRGDDTARDADRQRPEP